MTRPISPRFDARVRGAGTEAERQIDRGEAPNESRIARLTTFRELIDLHIDDMCDVGKAPLRSKAATLELLKRQLGKCNMAPLDRERLIRFDRDRAAQGAGPVTVSIDIGTIKLILSHAAAVHGFRSRSSRSTPPAPAVAILEVLCAQKAYSRELPRNSRWVCESRLIALSGDCGCNSAQGTRSPALRGRAFPRNRFETARRRDRAARLADHGHRRPPRGRARRHARHRERPG